MSLQSSRIGVTTMTIAEDFAKRITALGFRVFIAKAGTYGFITDEAGSRVLSFSFNDGSSLSGNYGPPSTKSGTGWRIAATPHDLHTAYDVRNALYASPPEWTGNGWRKLTTLDEYLAAYHASSRFEQVPHD
jgi:hypothetical protein